MSNIVNNISMSINTTTNITTGSIGLTGSTGIGGSVGSKGTTGYQGFQGSITDWKDDMMKKYHNRFIIKTEYDPMTFTPTNLITDTNTNKEYKFTPNSISNLVEETEKFIQSLIIILRDEKINTILL